MVNGGHPAEPDPKRRAFLPVKIVTGGEDWVVSEQSAKGVYGDIDWHPIPHGHIALVKPDSDTDRRYQLAKSFFQSCRLEKDFAQLARIRGLTDALWETRKGKLIRNWRYNANLKLREPHPVEQLARAGLSPCSFSCQYRTLLEQKFVVVGLSHGQAGMAGVWSEQPEPAYVHQMLVDLVPEGQRSEVTKGIDRLFALGDNQQRWAAFFPSMAISINAQSLIPGEIQPAKGPPQGWLRRCYVLPEDARQLVGEEVEFETNIRFAGTDGVVLIQHLFPLAD